MVAVLFDAAGTLIELGEPVGATYARALRAHGGQADAARLDDAFRAAFRAMPPMVFPRRGLDETVRLEREWWRRLVESTFRAASVDIDAAALERCFDELFAHYARPDAWRLVRGAREVLAGLRERGLRTAVVSNFDHRLPAILRGLDVAALFDAVVLPSDAGAAKPDRRIFLHALELLGVGSGEALYVGDDAEEDIAGARSAGITAVDVASLPRLDALLDRPELRDAW